MGKHKKDNDKSKKHKKEKKSKRSRHDSAGSDHSHSTNEEIVWAESGGGAVPDLAPTNSTDQPTKVVDIFAAANNNDDSSQEEEPEEGSDWLGLIQQTSKGNVKQAHLNRDKLKKEHEAAENKIRYARELNSYYRDDEKKQFIEDPQNFWKTKSKAMETDSESDDSSGGSDGDDHQSDGGAANDRPQSTGDASVKKLSDAERNAINAKLIKAEMMGNTELVDELKAKLKEQESATDAVEEVHYVKKRKSKAEQQAKEEQMSVKELYFQTRAITTREEAMRFVASSSKLRSNEDEYEEVRGKKKKLKVHNAGFERLRPGADQADKCTDCLAQVGKHLGLKFAVELKHCFVCFTPYEPFTANYCQIRSRSHTVNNSVGADEECWTELRQVMRLLSSFFAQAHKCSVVFMETHFVQQKRSHNISRRHFVIECVPIKERLETDARIYFHKAIMECEEEWAMNKKLIKLEGKSVTRMIPKGLAYFWVSFGANFNGFAHVIEDEDYFNKDFGKEIIGGLRDIEPNRWKRPKLQDNDTQMKRTIEVKNQWNDFIRHH